MVHDRQVKGSDLILKDLEASGDVKHGNLVMIHPESGSLILQETGKIIEGPLKGKRLQKLPADQWMEDVRFDDWHRMHPNTRVLICDHCEGQ